MDNVQRERSFFNCSNGRGWREKLWNRLLTGTLVPMAMTTNPMVNLSTLRMHPDRPTNVTMAKLKMAIQTIDIVKEAKKYLRLCGLLQSGIVQVNIQMNGKLSTNNTQPSKNLNGARAPPSSGYSGNSADTAGKHGHGLIFSCTSSSSFPSAMDSMSTFVSLSASAGTV